MTHRPRESNHSRRPVLVALLLAACAASCFTGDDLLGQPCEVDADCNPDVDVLGESLECLNSVCRKTAARCGDRIVDEEAGEQCDDGNSVDGDGCSASCGFEGCGNGKVEGQEQCDDANADDDDGCASCRLTVCGDGRTQAGEQCDDGNSVDGDGCSARCSFEDCGDGEVGPGEQCDDANADNRDACVACKVAVCGDGVTWLGVEACDDGNSVDGDGCSASCGFEG